MRLVSGSRLKKLTTGAFAVAAVLGTFLAARAVTAPPVPSWTVYIAESTNASYLSQHEAGQAHLRGLIAKNPNLSCTRYFYGAYSNTPAPGTFIDAKVVNGQVTYGCVGPTLPDQPYYTDTLVAMGQTCYSNSSDERCHQPYNGSNEKNVGAVKCDGQIRCGDPIDPGTGNEFLSEVDYQAPPGSRLSLVRYYNSSNYAAAGEHFSQRWRHSFEYRLIKQGGAVKLQRPDGSVKTFGGSYGVDADENGVLDEIIDATGIQTGWTYDDLTDQVETYDLLGKLTRIDYRSGGYLTFQYNADLRVVSVTDQYGRSLNFTYAAKTIYSVQTPAGVIYYTVNSTGITGVNYPDQSIRSYVYGETSNDATSNTRGNLTGIVDGKRNRYATIRYDNHGRAYSSELAGGVDKVVVAYSPGAATVTDVGGNTRSFTFNTVQKYQKATAGVLTCASGGCATQQTTAAYDDRGNQTSFVGADGLKTCMSYDLGRNLLVTKAEGLSASASCGSVDGAARVTNIEWHPSLRLPVRVAEPNLITVLTRDDNGHVLSMVQTPTQDGTGAQGFNATPAAIGRATTMTYNAMGNVLSIDGPRAGDIDKTVFEYGDTGYLTRITEPGGYVTSSMGHDASGNLTYAVLPSGATLTQGYDFRGNLLGRWVDGVGADLSYDKAGLLYQAQLESGETFTYAYDAAHRLTSVTDSRGNVVQSTVDLRGNVTQRRVLQAGATTVLQTDRVFDALGRIQQVTGASGL